MENLGEQSVRSNYDLLKGVLTSLPVDSTRHAYLMSNLDRLYEAYLRAWEKWNTVVPADAEDYGLVKRRVNVSTASSKLRSPDWVDPSGSASSEASDTQTRESQETPTTPRYGKETKQ